MNPRLLTSHDRPVWLHVGTLLDGTSTMPQHDAHVVYDAKQIRFVGTNGLTPPRDLLRDGQNGPDVTALDATLLPGLIEAHAHLFLEGGEFDSERRAAHQKRLPPELLAAARERLPKLVALGIAGVRDAGDKDGVGLALSKLYARRQAQGGADLEETQGTAGSEDPALQRMPYVESPGAAIHHRGRYGSFMADALENYPSPRACVEARIAAGADRIKLIPTGIINFKQGAVTSEPQMTAEEIAAIVSAAKANGRQTFAHASGDSGIDRVIAGGVDSVEHGFFVRDDQLAQMRDTRIAWVPTFAPVQKQIEHADRLGWDANVVGNLRRILDQHAASLVRARAMGVIIIAGSDAGSWGVAHGIGLLEEMALMEHAGLPPIIVINSATGASAARLRYRETIGQISVGSRSRFILTRHSPLNTVTNLRKTRTIIFDGEMFDTPTDFDLRGL